MPDPGYKTLVHAGPFRGINASIAQDDEESDDASFSSNADSNRYNKAMGTARGRVNLTAVTGFLGLPIGAVTQAVVSSTERAIIVSTGIYSGSMASFIPDGIAANISPTINITGAFALGWNTAVQFGQQVFCNGGSQLYYDASSTATNVYNQAALWQCPGGLTGPSGIISGVSPIVPTFTVTAGAGLPAGTYYYATTLTISFPAAFGNIVQNTSPYGAFLVSGAYPYGAIISGANDVVITTTGMGTNVWSYTVNGIRYDTNIWRQSTNQPTWVLLASSNPSYWSSSIIGTLTNGSPYTDTVPDVTIGGNVQLNLYHDAPPNNQQNLGPIFAHKNRMWSFVMQSTFATNYQPQCQLWFSDYGNGSSFNATYSVLLVNTEGSVQQPTSYSPPPGVYKGYGDYPMAGVSLASAALLYKSESMAVLWGDDPSTFIVRAIGGDGTDCIAPFSPAACGANFAAHLSSQGVYVCDGNSAPVYISENIRVLLEAIAPADQAKAVGWYSNREYNLSFPTIGVTYTYHFPTQAWRSRPYATSCVYSNPSMSAPQGTNSTQQRWNEVIGVRPSSTTIDVWDAAETDLGLPVTATWQTALTDSGVPEAECDYRFVGLLAPIQPGVKASIELQVYNQGQATPQTTNYPATGYMDLGAKVWHAFPIPQGSQKGYLVTMTITLVNAPGATTAAQIFSVKVGGTFDRFWAIPQGTQN